MLGMPSVKDPEGAELAALAEVVDLAGRRVLEIGCGDGRLTFRYAVPTAEVLGIDPDEEAIATARRDTPPELAGRVRFAVGGADELAEPPQSFDVAFLSWSL